ncbi:unnamed protein product [Rotaria sp. Silwood1]|nr:unnamed protein product [Rotaria sp. Silwood1]CAF4846693.1 unnamed protein product [Rotaria sp. Silwood1]
MLYKLVHIQFDMYEAWFDDFKIFMSKLCAPIQVLRIKYHIGSDYLEADEWEHLIKMRLPYLRTFDYEYHEDYVTAYEDNHFHTKINRFTSSFWIKHQWFFEFGINMDEEILVCSIHPYSDSSHDEHQLFINTLKPTFLAVQFTRLKIDCKHIPIGIFIKIMHLFPHLDSLEVLSLPNIQPDWVFDNYVDMHQFATPIDNKIVNVNLNKIIYIEQVHFFLYLCPSIEYFQVNIPKHMDLKMLLRFILTQANTYNFYFRFLCLGITNASEDMLQQLQKMIDSEQLLSSYMIKRIGNYICLKWN